MSDVLVTALTGDAVNLEIAENRVVYNLTVQLPKTQSVTIMKDVLSGPMGPQGPEGPIGPMGETGIGIPDGGNVNQILAKASNTSFDTVWIDNISSDYGAVFNAANTAANIAISAFNAANTADDQAIAEAYNQANVALIQANSAYNLAVLAYDAANTADDQAIAEAYNQANLSYNTANSALLQIIPAFNQANDSFVQASAAFNQANSTLPLSGGIITGDLSIVGNLNLSGNTIFLDASRLQIEDPLIYLAGNNYSSDIVDIGFIANYVNSTGSNVHTGLYREHENKMYYLFQGYDQEPRNNHIGAMSNNMTLAVLNADLRTSNIELAGTNTINWITSSYDRANLSFNQANTARDQANLSFNQANLSFNQANTARDQANLSFNQANLAFIQANTARDQANVALYVNTSIKTVTSNYSILSTDSMILSDTTSNITISLPSAASLIGRSFEIKNINIGTVSIVGSGIEKIDGYNSMTVRYKNSIIGLRSIGSGWIIY